MVKREKLLDMEYREYGDRFWGICNYCGRVDWVLPKTNPNTGWEHNLCKRCREELEY